MSQTAPIASSQTSTLEYVAPGLHRRPPLVTVVAIISICVACLSLCANAEYIKSALDAAHRAAAGPGIWMVRSAAQANAIARRPVLRALTQAEISSALDYLDKQLGAVGAGDSLTAAQRQTLTRLLSTNGQTLIDPAVQLGSQGAGGVQIVRVGIRNQVLSIAIRHGGALGISGIRLDAAGQVLSLRSRPSLTPGPTNGMPPATIPPTTLQMFHDQYVSAILSAAVSGINLIVAAILIAAAACLLTQRPWGMRLHWVYVAIKLPLSILSGTDYLPAWFGISDHLIFPLGSAYAWVGCAYPILLLITLRTETFRAAISGAAETSASLLPGGSRPRLFTDIGRISIVVGCLSLAVSGFCTLAAITGMSNSGSSTSQSQDHINDFDFALFISITSGADLVLAVMLLIGAFFLLRNNPRGIRLHRLYIVPKLLTTIVGGVVIFLTIYHSPVGMIAPLVALPSVAALIYPIVLLFLIANFADQQAHPPPART